MLYQASPMQMFLISMKVKHKVMKKKDESRQDALGEGMFYSVPLILILIFFLR